MRRRISLAILFVFVILHGFSQAMPIKGRWSIKAAYSRFTLGSGYLLGQTLIYDSSNAYGSTMKNQYFLEGSYGFLNVMDVTIYGAYSRFPLLGGDPYEPTLIGSTAALFYGLSTNYYLARLLGSRDDSRFDPYFGQRLGFYRLSTQPGLYPKMGTYKDFGLHAGLSILLVKHLGIFGEFGIANGFTWQSTGVPKNYRTCFRVGLTVKI